MEPREEMLEESQVRTLSTPELIRHALTEARLLARAEVLHAKHELKEELARARTSAILVGAGAVLALAGVSTLFVALALVLPLPPALAALIVGLALLACAAALGYAGYRGLPKKPLARTQDRLKLDLTLAREELQ